MKEIDTAGCRAWKKDWERWERDFCLFGRLNHMIYLLAS